MKLYFKILIAFLTLYSPLVLSALNGEKLYKQYCSNCHRTGGEGGLGLPLEKYKFNYLTDDYIAKTIRLGRPGRVMPAFELLSDAQIKSIVGYFRHWSNTPSLKDSTDVIVGDSVIGKQIYDKQCSNCHGLKGESVGKGTGKSYSRKRKFDVIPPSLSNRGFQQSVSDTMLKNYLTATLNNKNINIAEHVKLKSNNADDVIVYIRQLFIDAKDEKEAYSDILPDPAIIVDSPHNFETTVANMRETLSSYNFRVFQDRFIEQGLVPEWEVNKRQITLRYCNFNMLYAILKTDPRVGIGMPCRISIIEDKAGKVKIVAMNLALIARLFNNDQLQKYAQEMNSVQLDIIEEVTF